MHQAVSTVGSLIEAGDSVLNSNRFFCISLVKLLCK